LLCELLASTELAGAPQEYGIESDDKTWRKFSGFSKHEDYFWSFLDTITVNQVCGIKLMWAQFEGLANDLVRYAHVKQNDRRTVVEDFFPNTRYIRIYREDRVRQAISLIRAQQTGFWNSMLLERSSATYNRLAILKSMRSIADDDRHWQCFLAGVPEEKVFSIKYEDLIVDLRAAQKSVLSWLGLPFENVGFCEPRLRKQANAATEEWVSLFTSEPIP